MHLQRCYGVYKVYRLHFIYSIVSLNKLTLFSIRTLFIGFFCFVYKEVKYMDIKFFRGNDHEVRFKIKSLTSKVEKMWLTVKCEKGKKRLQKKLDDGIVYEDDSYIITFVPEDTAELECTLNMVYDIKAIIAGKRKTLVKANFIIDEDVTTSKDEV